jgi:hypothetical protein
LFDYNQALETTIILTGKKVTFVQIGANDGKRNDPLFKTLEKNKDTFIGVQVEPDEQNFYALRELHAGAEGWTQVRAVISPQCDANGTVTFHRIDMDKVRAAPKGVVPKFVADGQSNSVIINSKLNAAKDFLAEITVPCIKSIVGLIENHASTEFLEEAEAPRANGMCRAWGCTCDTLASMTGIVPGETWGKSTTQEKWWWVSRKCDKGGLPSQASRRRWRIDVLQIDVEGHDAAVLSLVDFAVVRPAVINFENKCVNSRAYQWAVQLLRNNSYWVYEYVR